MAEGILQTRKAYNSGGYNPGGGNLIKTGTASITTGGSLLNVDTGLTTILQAFITVKDTDQDPADGAYCTYDHGTDGLLDIYVWDDAGQAAANDTEVSWMVIGTK
jgi:hypothetical protein